MATQEDGIWGRSITYRERQNFDEDEQTGSERFIQSRLRYRNNHKLLDSYTDNSIGIRRHRDTGLSTLVSQNLFLWRQSRYREHSFRLNGYYQLKAPLVGLQGGWSLIGTASTGWRQYWQDNVDNRIDLSIFGRVLSLSENDIYPGHDESEAGDLAFFDDHEGNIVHVGLLLENHYILHAHGKVRIDRIDQTGIYNFDTQQHSHKLRIIKKII